MSSRLARRLAVGSLLLGGAALAACPGPATWIGLGQVGLCLPALFLPPRPDHDAWRVANTAALLVAMILVSVRADLLVVVAGLLAWLGVHRAWTARLPEALQVGAALAMLEGMLCARLGAGPSLDVAGVALFLLAPLAAAVAHTPRLHTALCGLAAGAVGLLAAGLLQPSGAPSAPSAASPSAAEAAAPATAASVGFARQISLGALGPLHDDPAIVARVRPLGGEAEAGAGGMYLHGVALDRFSGGAWSATAPELSVPLPARPEAAGLLRHEVALQPLTGGVLLGVAPVVAVESAEPSFVAWRDALGTWRHTGVPRAVRYTATSLPDPQGGLLVDRSRWLALPADLDPEIRTLAARLAQEAPPGDRRQKADFLVAWLREGYAYTRVPPPETARQALSAFLFESRAGHCEYFATALAVLLRAQGIEARVVSGLRGGEADGDGRIFRQQDAHAWVEMFVDGEGWLRLDATPPELRAAPLTGAPPAAALRLPGLPPAGARQVLVGGSAALAGLALLLGGGVAARRWRRGRGAAVERCWRSARRLVRQRGWSIPPALPPAAAGAWLRQRAGQAGAPLEELGWMLYRHRYDPASPVPAGAARAALRRLRRGLPRARAPGRQLTGRGARVN